MPQYINIMEAAHKKSARTPLPVTNAVMQAIAFRANLASGEYPDNMRKWQKLTPAEHMWDKCNTECLLAYADKELIDKARDAVGQPFGGQSIVQALTQQVQPQVTNQMVETLDGYLNNISAAATTTGRGKELDDFAASMAILVDTNASQAKVLKQMRYQINDFCNNNHQADASGPPRTVCPHCTAAGGNVLHAKYECLFNPKSIKNIPTWSKELMRAKGVAFEVDK